MMKRLAGLLALVLAIAPAVAGAQSAHSAAVSGRVLSANGGLPVQDATVELDRAQVAVATAHTDANGIYRFTNQEQGEYSLLIVARGFAATRVPSLFLFNGNTTNLQTAIEPSSNQSTNLKEISHIVVAGRQSLQTSTTVNEYVDPQQAQSQDYVHTGFLLARLPGVNMYTSPSLGDDMTISIRGFDPSENAVLLDGHPIGPIGAYGGANAAGFDYKLAPFWGLSGTSVIFGSGATGLYGASTVAGAVNFDTLTPTPAQESQFIQGVGNDLHSMTGFSSTGTLGKLGYAFAGAVQGSTGSFPGGVITQTALLANSQWCNSGATGAPSCTNGSGKNVQPPDLTNQNIQNINNTYFVSGAYTQHNGLAKLQYSFSPKTQLLTTLFTSNSWNDKTGNGDQDNLPYQYVLTQEAPGLEGNNFLLNGSMTNCSSTNIAVLNNSSAGYECLTAQQFAQNFNGPYGGGLGRWNDSHMQDYHTRFTQQIGNTQFLVDGFINNYDMDEHKSPVGPFYLDDYFTHGLLASDEFQLGNNDVAFGYYTQHQEHQHAAAFASAPSSLSGPYFLGTQSYFARDTWQMSPKFSTFADVWYQHSVDTKINNFDPRLSFVFRPTPSDVLRLTGGRSYSEPDPALLDTTSFSLSAPNSVNVGTPYTVVASGGNPNLRPETAIDEEFAYGHRFSSLLTMQFDAYNTLQNNAILSAVLPLTNFPQYLAEANQDIPGTSQTWLQGYLAHLPAGTTVNNLGVSLDANTAQAVYRGFNLEATIDPIRNLTVDAQYGIQSAYYQGIPTYILQNNPYLINGAQFDNIPMHKAFASVAYQNDSGTRIEFDQTYIGNGNELRRPAFWYTDAALSKSAGPLTLTLGASNLFNEGATVYGYFGLGTFQPVNQYASITSALQEGSAAELYGMTPRQIWLTLSVKTGR
jgi:outer membrane receptor protein involved in Fe transport